MSVLSLPLSGPLSRFRPSRSRGFLVEGVSAVVPGTDLRLPVVPAVRDVPPAGRCVECAGTGVSFHGGLLGTCWCFEFTSAVDEAPAGASPADPAVTSTCSCRAEPGGMVPVYPVGPVWATAAEILAVVVDHWYLLTGGHRPGGQSVAWVRETAGNLFDPGFRWPFRPDLELSESWLRGHLAEDALAPQEAALVVFVAGLVAEAFGPIGLALPKVAA
jgi:hypothetical protein